MAGIEAAMAWVCSSCGANQIENHLGLCATCGAERQASAGSYPREADGESESLVKAGAVAAGGCALDMLVWLMPVLVLGGTGLILLKFGSKETVDVFGQTDTELTSTGWIGGAFLCFAVAVFFGRGVIRSLYGMVKSRTMWRNPWRVRDDVVGLGLATIAILAGLLSLAFAAGIIGAPEAGTPTTGLDQDQVP